MAIYCRNCGKALSDEARFCSGCGAQMYPPAAAPYPQTVTRLVRPRAGRMIAGVCQGLANAYAWDVVWVRVITVLLTVFGGGSGLLAYVIFWIVMPEEPLMIQPTAPPPAAPYPPSN
ncbi:MAG TPA: PspC domain-containing protein [Acidobacteriaceae bacterium]|nr:PspC domain-containing protein [Acidobacteriaceae bacterium]